MNIFSQINQLGRSSAEDHQARNMPPPNPAAVVVGMAVMGAVINLSLHRIEEGHVGVYYRGGALLKTIANPGFHMMIPLLTTYR